MSLDTDSAGLGGIDGLASAAERGHNG